jgi:cytochrome c biogenesis protein CcdA/thiol-disulfide isomerase/thioredoxin
MVIVILFAALSGLVTVLSPCILPILPVVLSSSANQGKARPVGVIAGLILSFSVFTLLVSRLVALLGLSANTLRLAAVVIIGLLGLSMIVPVLNTWVEKAFSLLPGLAPQNRQAGAGFGAGFLTGTSLGLIWAPCAGPILAAVTALVATQTISWGTVLVVVAYAIGSGVPLLAIAYGGRALIHHIPFLTRNLLRVQQTFGIVMVLTAGLIAFNADTLVTARVTAMIPASWNTALDSFETSPAVSQQLGQLVPGGPAISQPVPVTGGSSQIKMDLPNLGAAPDFTGISNWINSSPLTMKDLQGKVVLVDFWTYTCINCIHTLPYVTGWYSKYKDQGFVVIGVHTPEFSFEHETHNVTEAMKGFGITYPVAQDNDYATWKAYNNIYWPAEYLIDANGNLRYTHFGEGNYDVTEKVIQALLAESGHGTAN